MASKQASVHARPEPQVVEADRDDERRLVCPDCGSRIGPTRGGHDLPDGRRVHGWACSDCQNVVPGTCHSPDAPTWTQMIEGIEAEYRDGTTRLVAGIRDSPDSEAPG